MTSILFPVSDKRDAAVPAKKDFAYFMSDIARASSDSADALDLFIILVEGSTRHDPDSPGFMAFDAHGGEAGCQLRAGMMLEIFTIYQCIFREKPQVWSTLRQYLQDITFTLRRVKENAAEVCAKMTKHKVNPKKIGFGSNDDPVTLLGWEFPLEPVDLSEDLLRALDNEEYDQLRQSCPVLLHYLGGTDDLGQSRSVSPSTSSSSTDPWSVADLRSKLLQIRANTSATSTAASIITDGDAEEDVAKAPQIAPPCPFTTTTISPSAEWLPLDGTVLVQFVVFCYVLSKYKSFVVHNGTVGARLSPEKAAAHSYDTFMRPHVGKVVEKRQKNARVVKELRDCQEWLAHLSCAWQRSLAQRSITNVDMDR